jgi:hypothetical protein
MWKTCHLWYPSEHPLASLPVVDVGFGVELKVPLHRRHHYSGGIFFWPLESKKLQNGIEYLGTM